MLIRNAAVLALCLVAATPFCAGFEGFTQSGRVTVRVSYDDGHGAGGILVSLVQSSGIPVSQLYTDPQGTADFLGLPSGAYRAVITGQGVQQVDSGLIEIDSQRLNQDVYLTIRRSRSSVAGTISAADLSAPDSARTQVQKASEASARQEWSKALQRLTKAIAIYPKYAIAYNNMGVVYGHLNDTQHEREALEKAIVINDHFTQAFINLALLSYHEQKFEEAETLMKRAESVDPRNSEVLALLSQAELVNKHYDAAIQTVRAAHESASQHSALVHFVAARAFAFKSQLENAVSELQVFLREEPEGKRAEQVRSEILRLKQHTEHRESENISSANP